MMVNQGTLFIVSAPSGAGKSSLIQALLQTHPAYDLKVSISHTTRDKRPNEVADQHYYFVSVSEFEEMIAAGDFIEYAKVFDNYYGTAVAPIERMLKQGIDILLDIDWQGAQQVRKKIPNTRTIFILPPSREELARRLLGRGQDSEVVIAKRMQQSITEMSHFHEYDYLIINDDFDQALQDMRAILRAERLSLQRQAIRHDSLIGKLLAQ